MRCAASALTIVLGACGSTYTGEVPSSIVDIPWVDPVGERPVLQARELQDRRRPIAALAMLDEFLAENPRHVDGHRVRQDLLRSRGRIGRVLAEAEQRERDWDGDPNAIYLRGRVQTEDGDKRASFERVLEARPDSFWGWLGLAYTLRRSDPLRAVGIYAELYGASGRHPLVAVPLASALRETGNRERAIEVYEALRGAPAMAGVGDLGIAETRLSAGEIKGAWAPLLTALRQRPADPGVTRSLQAIVGRGVSRDQVEQILDVLYEDPSRLDAFARGGGAPVLASLFEQRGQLPAAREVLARPEGADWSAPVQRHRRTAMLSVGDVRGFLAALRAATPGEIVRDERNQVRGRWVRLLDGSWSEAADPLADARDAAELPRALLRAGLLVEADLVATLALERHPDAAAIVAVRSEARREIAFEGAMRRVVYHGYLKEGFDLDQVLEELRGVSRRILGADVIGEPERFRIPLVGELVDPFGSPLAQHLARYNRHLVLGRRSSGSVEGLLLTRLSVRELGPSAELPLSGRCLQVVGDDRQLRPTTGVLGGDLAGVALLDHYVIDYDAVRDWASSIRERRRIAHEDDAVLLDDPLPGEIGPLEPADVAWRLALVSPVEDSELELAVFDMICAHERAHLIDSFHYLPPMSNLWRVLGLLIAHGFSALSIEAQMEGRAEAGALTTSPHTELVLAHIADFLDSDNEESPHAIGFTRLGAWLQARLAEDPDHVENAAVSRWHLVPPARMRELGREFLRR